MTTKNKVMNGQLMRKYPHQPAWVFVNVLETFEYGKKVILKNSTATKLKIAFFYRQKEKQLKLAVD
jgi:hypothetical protein